MNTNKTNFHRKHTDKNIKAHKWIYALLLLVMFGFVLHDSFVHLLPFHYILYGIGGILTGWLVSLTYEINFDKEKKVFHIKLSNLGIFVLLLLLIIRFFAGRLILQELDVVWATDAVYLWFIGIYLAKFKNIVKRIDSQIYSYVQDMTENNQSSD